MADTGAPWNIPYVEDTDLVRDYPSDSQDLADAIALGLDAAGKLVAVKHALFTGTQTNSTATGANFAVTDLTITHTLADAANKLIISVYGGVLANSSGDAAVGLLVFDGSTAIAVGDAEGSRTRVTTGFRSGGAGGLVNSAQAFTIVYTPGDTASHTYTVQAVNPSTDTQTIYINRAESDTNNAARTRASSGFVIQEVKV
jgi:hypothetical protein